MWLSRGTAFSLAVATSARHHCFEVGELSLFHFLFDFLSFSFFVWFHRHWKMMPQGQYRLCGLWIYSPLVLKGESKLFPLIGFDSSYFNLNRIFELKLTQKFPFRLVPSTQELLRPPVTTIITNMTNAFIVRQEIAKYLPNWESMMLFKSKSLSFQARTRLVGFEIASHKNIHTQMCYIIEGFTQNYYLETKISSLWNISEIKQLNFCNL